MPTTAIRGLPVTVDWAEAIDAKMQIMKRASPIVVLFENEFIFPPGAIPSNREGGEWP